MLALLPAFVYSQVRPYIGGARADSISFKLDNYTKWITAVSDDITLAGNSHKKATTEYAVKGYVNTQTVNFQDSINKHTDTLQLHNVRIKANAASIIQKQDSINRHTDTLQLHNVRIKKLVDTTVVHNNRLKVLEGAGGLASLSDSIDKHTDTLQLHNVRIKSLEIDPGGGILDTTGLPVAGSVPVFTSATHLGGYTGFTYRTNTLKLTTASSDTALSIKSASSGGIGADINQTVSGTAFQARYNSLGLFKITRDSIIINKELITYDSIYAKGYDCVTRYGYPYLDSITKVIRIDSTALSAAYGLIRPFQSANEMLLDTLNGEIAWYVDKDKKIYSFDKSLPGEINKAFMAAHEMELRQIAALEKEVDILKADIKELKSQKSTSWIQLGVLTIVFAGIFLVIMLIKKNI